MLTYGTIIQNNNLAEAEENKPQCGSNKGKKTGKSNDIKGLTREGSN